MRWEKRKEPGVRWGKRKERLYYPVVDPIEYHSLCGNCVSDLTSDEYLLGIR